MPDPTQQAFRALADPTRRDIIRLLSHQDMTLTQLTAQFDITRAAVKKHLTMLGDGGLVTVEPRGRERLHRLNPAGLAPVIDWLGWFDRYWDDRLGALKSAIERTPS